MKGMPVTTHETRAQLGLLPAKSKPRIPGPVLGVGIHYNGPPMGLLGASHDACQTAWRGIQQFHMGPLRRWVDIAYTMGACPHGVLLAGRGAGVRTAANGTNAANNQYYAIMALLGEGEEPTAEMLTAIVDGVAMLGETEMKPHSAFKPTACPGTPLRNWVNTGGDKPTIMESDMIGVKYGEQSERVEFVQRIVNDIRFEDVLKPDGKFGDNTARVLGEIVGGGDVYKVDARVARGLVTSLADSRAKAAVNKALKEIQ